MKTFFAWNDAYSINYDAVDSQHKGLLEMGRLLENVIANKHTMDIDDFRTKLEDIVCDLVCYTEFHFSTEEGLMLKHNYADLAAHKIEHHRLIEKVSIMKDAFLSDNLDLIEHRLSDLMSSWLTDHIIKFDMPLSSIMNDK